MILERASAILCACVLDALLGDPYRMPHIVRLIGRIISYAESVLYPKGRVSEANMRLRGALLVAITLSVTLALVGGVRALAHKLHPIAGLIADTLVCYQMVSAKQLAIEALKVKDALDQGDLKCARRAVSMIVGRDTDELDEAAIIRAAIETVAENTSDGVVAPLFYLTLFGPLGGVAYKCVNTMDSMVGYKNDRYLHFGTAAARLDDILNLIPARLTGALMCLVAPFVGLSGKGAWRVFLRDRLKHASPNSAHTEAAAAGALGVQLAGPASYFGVVSPKPWIGDDERAPKTSDIAKSVRLMYGTSFAALLMSLGSQLGLYLITSGR